MATYFFRIGSTFQLLLPYNHLYSLVITPIDSFSFLCLGNIFDLFTGTGNNPWNPFRMTISTATSADAQRRRRRRLNMKLGFSTQYSWTGVVVSVLLMMAVVIIDTVQAFGVGYLAIRGPSGISSNARSMTSASSPISSSSLPEVAVAVVEEEENTMESSSLTDQQDETNNINDQAATATDLRASGETDNPFVSRRLTTDHFSLSEDVSPMSPPLTYQKFLTMQASMCCSITSSSLFPPSRCCSICLPH